MAHDFQELIFGAVQEVLEPLAQAATDDNFRRDLFRRLGWETDAGTGFPEQNLIAALATFATSFDTLKSALASTPTTLAQLADTFKAVTTAVSELEQLGTLVSAGAPSAFSEAAGQLLNLLVVDQLALSRPALYAALRLLTVIRDQTSEIILAADPTAVLRTQTTYPKLDFSQLLALLKDPIGTLRAEYGLTNGLTDANGTADLLFPRMADLLRAMNVQVTYGINPSVTPVDLGPVGDDIAAHTLTLFQRVPSSDPDLGGGFGVGAVLEQALGLVLNPFGVLEFSDVFGKWAVAGTLTVTPGGIAIKGASITFPDAVNDGSASFEVTLNRLPDLTEGTAPDGTTFLIGAADGTRVELGGFTITLDASFSAQQNDYGIKVQTGKSTLVITAGEGDGFLSAVLPSTAPINFDLDVGWSRSRGFHFDGSASLQITLPVNATVGPVAISNVRLRIEAGDGVGTITSSADVGVTLGPVAATIQGVGADLVLSFPDGGGSLGPADAALGFQFPTGVGIAVNAGPVHGGGFISFDPDAGRYSGALELSIYDVSVKAFGLIETKVPGVSFSFVIVISAEFTPIQLGFGFTLNGVGGLVGINRSVDSNALAGLVRAGQSEELLFPKNLIANAPTIIRDLGTVFPARQSHYVFGPLGKLGWGTPTLITGEIGIILELPGPVVVLIGEVKCLLPKPDQALVKLNLSIAGTLDFPNKSFSLDAALHDSIINGYPVSGQMAMRILWGEQPNFVLSIGGFHPAYQPPKDFPKLQPMALDLGQHGSASITVSGFFAVTSNTVQVGGDARLHAGGGGISLDASVGVKALFVFSPFSFQANIDASVKISFHGHGPSVHLSGLLEGPSPWHIRGEVCVSILFWDACLGFDETFGGGEQPSVPELDPWVGVTAPPAGGDKIIGLQTALEDAGNWSGVAPVGTASVVSRVQGTEALVDPLGGLTLRQKAVPVETDQPISRFGVAKVKTPISYKLGTASFGNGLTLQKLAPVNDFFAPAQYFQMDDGKKLSSAGFEQRQAGYVFGENANNLRSGSNAPKTLAYTTFLIGGDGSITPAPAPFQASNAHVAALNTRSAVARGGATQAGTRRFIDRLVTQAFEVHTPTFVLASNTALTAIAESPAATTRSAALLALDAFRVQNPQQRLQVQVSVVYELA